MRGLAQVPAWVLVVAQERERVPVWDHLWAWGAEKMTTGQVPRSLGQQWDQRQRWMALVYTCRPSSSFSCPHLGEQAALRQALVQQLAERHG